MIGEASDGQQAVKLAADLCPELVLMDMTRPEFDGSKWRILVYNPGVKVSGVTVKAEREIHSRMLAVGTVAVEKRSLFRDVHPAIMRLCSQSDS